MSLGDNIRTIIDATNGTYDDTVESNPTLEIYKPANFHNGITASLSVTDTLVLTHGLTVTGNIDVTGRTTAAAATFTSGLTASISFFVTSSTGTDTLNVQSNTIVFLNAAASPFTVTLPNATSFGSGSFFHIKKTDNTNNAITISASNSQLIDNSATQVISLAYTSIKLVSNADTWWVI